MLGPLEQYMTPTLDMALLSSSRAGTDLGRTLGLVNIRDYVFNELLLRGAEAGFKPGT